MANQNAINQNGTLFFAVNGQRPRGNNFMIDGVENNDISVTGPAFTITNSDAVQEVNVQLADFSSEFGRAGGAVINQITKSGTNSYHGSAAWVYTGSSLAALNHLDKTGGLTRPARVVENIPDFTFGGPVVIPGLYNGHGKTFFFAAGQWDRRFGNITSTVRAPDSAGVALLQTYAAIPACYNAALYLQVLGTLRGNPSVSPVPVSLAVPTPGCNGATRAGVTLSTGLVTRVEPAPFLDNNHTIRIDHIVSDKQTISVRWLYDQNDQSPSPPLNNLLGFDSNLTARAMSGVFTDTYVISPTWTNELRFNYGRIGFDFERVAKDPFHLDLANYTGLGNGITGFGVATNIPQFRFANNWQYQDTLSVVRGTHTFRFGVDYLRQLARQHPPFNERGQLTYSASTGPAITAFANFLDDFGGRSGQLNRQFGYSIYHPNLFRQAYFFQDTWKTTQNLTLNLGLRYEYYGAPENIFRVSQFTNYDPVNFAAVHHVPSSKLNFGPTIGFAWNPKGSSSFDHIVGGEKMVWRGGFQISYDSSFNNLLSNMAGSSPNTQGANLLSPASGRGTAGFTPAFQALQPLVDKTSAQSNLFLGRFPSPRTARWSLGFQRELPWGMIWDTAYVGSVSRHLYQSLDMNPVVDTYTTAIGTRFHSELQNPLPANFATLSPALQAQAISTRQGQGIRTVRAAIANSNYESLQLNLRRGFTSSMLGQLQFTGSYTYSHFLDNVSDVFARDSNPNAFQSAPQVLGFSPRIDYGNSDFDLRHVGSIGFLWSPPQPKSGIVGTFLGGWTVSGIAHWQDGIPFSVINGSDRGGWGQATAERADISNPNAALNTRAIIDTSCPLGFANPDVVDPTRTSKIACESPANVHWIEGSGIPNARTVHRNTLRTPFDDNLDLTVAKSFRFTEKSGIELRADMFNALNTTVLGFNTSGFVPRTVNGSGALKFLDFTQTDSTGRTMRLRVKLYF